MVTFSAAPSFLPTHLASGIAQPRRSICAHRASVGRCCIGAVQTSGEKCTFTAEVQAVVEAFHCYVHAAVNRVCLPSHHLMYCYEQKSV